MLLSFSYTDNKETNQQIDRTRISHVVIANSYNGIIAIYIHCIYIRRCEQNCNQVKTELGKLTTKLFKVKNRTEHMSKDKDSSYLYQ